MKIKENIQTKQHYIPPIIELLNVEDQGLAAGTEVTADPFKKDPDDEDEGGNTPAKGSYLYDFDDID